ncbi:MAG TPA: hypothetical protein VK528_13440 [Flavobacterium sp.]|nr:hypothetical protein [Flavobacterium sp.]
MKNYAPLFIAIASVFSLSCFAQRSDRLLDNSEMGNTQLISDRMSDNELAVVSYHVEETINMNFGGSVTTYNVSNLDMISTKDLGPNNSRIITPMYAKARAKTVATVNNEPPKTPVITIPVIPIKADAVVSEVKMKSVNIDIISTYERVLDKGYKDVDMLKRVGNSRFFHGDLVMAAKWYAQLFALTTDLEAVYYYRYAQSLVSISQNKKANEMMAIFENKNL